MFLDNSIVFSGGVNGTTGVVTGQSISTSTNVDSTNLVDITGTGVGTLPTRMIGASGLSTAIGADWGAGEGVAVPYVYITVTTTGTSANTLTITLQAAPDNGSGSAGSYTTIYTSKAFTGTAMVAGQALLFPVPPRVTLDTTYGEVLPRFYKLNYAASAALTVGLYASMVINPPTTLTQQQYGNNFVAV